MEPPYKKARIDHFSSQPMDKAARAAAVAAKLSQTLSRIPNAQIAMPSVTPFLGLGEPETIKVPTERVGQIIGKGGMKIQEIQEKAQVKMAIAKESNPSTPHLRDITLTGTMESIEKCKKLLKELFAEVKIREGGAPDRTIEIPINTVGLVIGKGGETIRRIIQETNCIVQVEKNEDWNATGRTPPKPGFQNVYLSGDQEQLDKGEEAVRNLVAAAGNHRPNPQNYHYGGGFMPPYGMPYPYPTPYGMPPGPYGNNFTPGQNFIPQPYHPHQMYKPPHMYNGQSNPYVQGSHLNPYAQAHSYSQNGLPYNPQGQPYSNCQAPYNPAAEPAPPSNGQNMVPPQINGYGGLGSGSSTSQPPFNPQHSAYYPPVTPYGQNQNHLAGQQKVQLNQIPGHINGRVNQIPWPPNGKSNQVSPQQNNHLDQANTSDVTKTR